MIDYKKIGLKCGIEIHQRLDTNKLFCDCLSDQKEEPHGEIKRKLRPVVGELGEYDPAAIYEFFRNRTFIYKMYPNESCLVEADEEPPHSLNEEALKIALQICKIFNCYVPDEIHVMRKTVIDGSNTSGFQRTAVVGLNGYMDTSFGKVKIPTICLEEEAARIESKKNGVVVYKLNGLGIPLVEIATSTVDSPEKAREVAEKIGLLLRSVKVQRGIGTIRQDVNVSIKNGARVEIKGFQEIKNIEKLIENEVKRQLALLEIKNELKRRGVSKINENFVDVTQLFKKTKCKVIKKIVEDGGKVFAIKLPLSGLMKRECGDRTLSKELVAYVQAYGIAGFIHSDEDVSKYNLEEEFYQLREKMKTDDLILIVAGKENLENACKALLDRVKKLLTGVPEETRVADGLGSKYIRPLPGAERMYPETDVPPILTKPLLKKIKVPETIEERRKKLEKQLPGELVQQILTSEYYEIFKELSSGFDPVLVATTLLNTMKSIKREGHDVSKITKEHLRAIFELVKKKRISKHVIPDALKLIIKGKSIRDIEQRFLLLSENELKKIVTKVAKKHSGLSEKAIIGIIMSKVKGRAHGEDVVKLLRKVMKKLK